MPERTAPQSRWTMMSQAMAAGLLLAAAFPPSFLWILAFPAVALLARLAQQGGGFLPFMLAGAVYHGLTLWWIGINCEPPPLLAALSAAGAVFWLSLVWAFVGLAMKALHRRLGHSAMWVLPCLLVSVDWLLEGTDMGFPWATLGVTQVDNPLLRPLAALGGVHALSLALLLAGLLLLWIWEAPRARVRWLALVAWCGIIPLLGWLARGDVRDTGRTVDLLLVQGNIDPEAKWDRPWMDTVLRHLELSQEALAQGAAPDLVIWPETAVPTKLRRRPLLMGELAGFCRKWDTALLTGANDAEPREVDDGSAFGNSARGSKPYNGSFLFTGEGLQDFYHKVRLVPFGERVPGQRWLPALGRINLGQAEFAPGTRIRAGKLPLRHGDTLSFGYSICFEGNFAALARDMVRSGAQLLTNQTNDAWFGTSRELDQHLAVARLRAVESGRWMVRACNNGYTAAIAPDGSVSKRLDKGVEGTLRVRVPLREGSTFFLWAGDLLPRLCLLLSTWAALLAWVGGRRRKLHP
jgi:apolipoprotein N-acyltransferase